MTKKLFITLILALPPFLILTPANAQHTTLGSGNCTSANCHAKEAAWWRKDAHYNTFSDIFIIEADYRNLAEKVGVGAGNLLKGNRGCMKCHGTVVSAKEGKEIDEGVSCESCHGPGSGYKDPHSAGDPKLGDKRTGYIEGLGLGMRELGNLDTRATTCVSCHYITDKELLRWGHPPGDGFNYVKGINQISEHWKKLPTETDLNNEPFKKAKDKLGPQFKAMTAEPPPQVSRPAPRPMSPPPSISVDPFFPLTAKGTITLEPFPNVPDTATFQEILMVVKQRLELLYSKIGR